MKSSFKLSAITALFLITFIPLSCQAQLTSTNQTSTTTSQTQNNSFIYTNGFIEVGGDGEPIELINNPEATDPTYQELIDFLKMDRTDEYSYVFGPPKNAYVCADFAEDVHNNAEAAGIRAAWVGIDLEGDSAGHAINAFQTTDIGMVYIDCTGKGLWVEVDSSRSSWDRRAYIEIGKPYAVTPELQEIYSWVENHDLEEIGRPWMDTWLEEHGEEWCICGELSEPSEFTDSQSQINSFTMGWDNMITQSWKVLVSCSVLPGIQENSSLLLNSKEIKIIDERPVEWQVMVNIPPGDKHLGIVEDVHIHW